MNGNEGPRGVSANLVGAEFEHALQAGLSVDLIATSPQSRLRVSTEWFEGDRGPPLATQRAIRRHMAATTTAILRACVSEVAARTWTGRCEWRESHIRCPSRADET